MSNTSTGRVSTTSNPMMTVLSNTYKETGTAPFIGQFQWSVQQKIATNQYLNLAETWLSNDQDKFMAENYKSKEEPTDTITDPFPIVPDQLNGDITNWAETIHFSSLPGRRTRHRKP